MRSRKMKRTLIALLLMSISTGAMAKSHLMQVAGLPSPFTPFTAPKTATSGPIQQIQKITIADLTNALTLANGQTNLPNGVTQPAPFNASVTGGDTRHGNCWA